jgi:TetR/AcrR family transcriptional regulator, regulator of autoinduction and epiphytic fitness
MVTKLNVKPASKSTTKPAGSSATKPTAKDLPKKLAPRAASAKKPSFKQQMLAAREEAIVDVVNRLLAEKGFDAMTVDEVAFEVGVAKASLYKHFPSKEDLATAAMVRAMQRATEQIKELQALPKAIDRLKGITRWMMQLKLAGEMPNLPSQNSSLRATLVGNKAYVSSLMEISDTLGGWVETAQADKDISSKLPAIVVLYTVYARACDPVLEFLKASELYSETQILDMVQMSCFEGLCQR